MRRHLPTVVVLVAVGVAACGGGDERVEPSSPLTATATASTSPSPTAVASPSPDPSPTPTGTPAVLTGVAVDDEALVRPALAVKIENTAKAWPQAGLEDADLVIEELVEGGITRFMAVFQSTVPSQVGPIRSARLVDASLLPAFSGALLYSGGRPDVEAAISGTAVRRTEGDPGVYRAGDRRAPSNLFADGPAVYEDLASRAPDLEAPATGFTFTDSIANTPCRACDGTAIDITFSPVATASWVYDGDDGVYRRSQNGTPQPTASGEPVGAANVVVVAVATFSGGCCDTAGSAYVVSRTTGEGRAVVLRDGDWLEATWDRASTDAPWRFSADGMPIGLAPGSTWLHLVPESRMPSMVVDAEG